MSINFPSLHSRSIFIFTVTKLLKINKDLYLVLFKNYIYSIRNAHTLQLGEIALDTMIYRRDETV